MLSGILYFWAEGDELADSFADALKKLTEQSRNHLMCWRNSKPGEMSYRLSAAKKPKRSGLSRKQTVKRRRSARRPMMSEFKLKEFLGRSWTTHRPKRRSKRACVIGAAVSTRPLSWLKWVPRENSYWSNSSSRLSMTFDKSTPRKKEEITAEHSQDGRADGTESIDQIEDLKSWLAIYWRPRDNRQLALFSAAVRKAYIWHWCWNRKAGWTHTDEVRKAGDNGAAIRENWGRMHRNQTGTVGLKKKRGRETDYRSGRQVHYLRAHCLTGLFILNAAVSTTLVLYPAIIQASVGVLQILS